MNYYIVEFQPNGYRRNIKVILRTDKTVDLLEFWVVHMYEEIYNGFTHSVDYVEEDQAWYINIDEVEIKFTEYRGYEI